MLGNFYKHNSVPESDRIPSEKNILLIVPTKDYDLRDVLVSLGLSRYEVAVTWPKSSVEMLPEVMAVNAKFVLQIGKRFFDRKFPFAADAAEAMTFRQKALSYITDSFVNLHHHDEFSLKDALGTVKQLVKLLKAQRRGFCCVTNHGSVGGWIKQHNACQEAGMKALYGMEAYAEDYRGDDSEERKKHRSAGHLILVARTQEGFENIIRLHNDAWLHGFYYSPRIDKEACRKWGKGIFATSACMGGEIPRLLMAGETEKAEEVYRTYKECFDEFLIEIQIIEFEKQREVNRRLIKFAEKVGAEVILGIDSHYLAPEHAETHDVLMCIRQHKTLKDMKPVKILPSEEEDEAEELEESEDKKDEEGETSDVWAFDVRNLYYRNAVQVEKVFREGFVSLEGLKSPPFIDDVFTEEVFRKAMGNTRRIAMTCEDIKLDSSVKLPNLYPDTNNNLWEKAQVGFKRRELDKKPNLAEYEERLKFEFDVICRMGFAGYFLIVEDIVRKAVEKYGEFAVGYGRGSAGGSLVSYVLGITDIDPIQYGLLFERFLDYSRKDYPDIDLDFNPKIRDDIKREIVATYGMDNVCSIGTYQTYKTKAVILDVARVLGEERGNVKLAGRVTKEMDSLASFEDDEGEEHKVDQIPFDELCEHYPELKEYFGAYPEVRTHVEVLRNQVRGMSTHAGGVIISGSRLKDKIPVLWDKPGNKEKRQVISAWAEGQDKAELSAVGLVKFDILGLANLPVISDCLEFIHKTTGKRLLRKEIPIDDKEAIVMSSKDDLVGIFQMESSATKPVSDAVGMESIDDLAAITSLIRPGPKNEGMDMTYARRKHGESYSVIPCIAHIMERTYGVLTYQEQMMQISKVLCGFDGPMANKLRKACLTLDCEFISRSRGPITLRRMLKEGYKQDLFLQKGQDGKVRWETIAEIWKTGKKRVKRTRTMSGHFVDATRLHQFLTDDGWKAQQRLTEDRIVCSRRIEWFGQDVVSRDFAVVVAGLLTEGYTPKGLNRATFTSYDSDFMNVFVKAFEREFGKEGGSLSSDGRVYRIRSSACKRIFKVMEKGLSEEKAVPDAIMGSTLPVMSDVLSFMLGAEGGVDGNGRFEYSSKSEKMALQVKTMLLRFGVRSILSPKDNSEYGRFWRLSVCDVIEQKKMMPLLLLWPSSKRGAFLRVFNLKGRPNFTKDTIPQRVVERMLNQYPQIGKGESGTVYSSSLSRSRFARLAERTKDSEWIRLADSDFWFDEHVGSEEVVSCHMDVYDFQVGGDYPNMIVNGIVVHNCGKKNQELMASVKNKFIEGAKPRIVSGEVTLEQVERLWELIASFASYSFNLSHAVEYSAISTVELWLKHNYFAEFMAALIGNSKLGKKKHGKDIFVSYIAYARSKGLPVLGPDINQSKVGFNLERSPTGEKQIRFSLGHIKYVAAQARVIESFQPFVGIQDFHERVKVETVTPKGKTTFKKQTKRVVYSLIEAGAFDSFGSRNQMMKEYHECRAKKDEEVPQLTDEEWLEKEKVATGLCLSRKPIAFQYVDERKKNGWKTLKDVHSGKKLVVVGRIESIVPKISKAGNTMLIVNMSDDIEDISFFVFQTAKLAFEQKAKVGLVLAMPLDHFQEDKKISETVFFDSKGTIDVLAGNTQTVEKEEEYETD